RPRDSGEVSTEKVDRFRVYVFRIDRPSATRLQIVPPTLRLLSPKPVGFLCWEVVKTRYQPLGKGRTLLGVKFECVFQNVVQVGHIKFLTSRSPHSITKRHSHTPLHPKDTGR